MSDRPLRLAYCTSHPIQYQAPLFRRVAASEGVALRVFFGTGGGGGRRWDPGFGRALAWDVPLLDGYDHRFVRNYAPRPTSARFFGLVNPGLVRALRTFAPDAVIVHGYAHLSSHLAILGAHLAGAPVLVRGESNLLPGKPLWKRTAKRLGSLYLRRALAGAVAIGSRNRDYWVHYGLPPERVFLAPYAVDNVFFQSRAEAAADQAAAWRAELGLTADTFVVAFAGKLIEVKGVDLLIDAFAAARIGDAALVIFGDGPERDALARRAARHPHARVVLRGFVNQQAMPAAYAMGDVVAVPSRFEPWGLVVNEAMNLARPVIASDRVGSVDDLVSEETGWVYPYADRGALARALEAAARSPERRRAMGARARARIDAWGLDEAAAGLIAAARAVAP